MEIDPLRLETEIRHSEHDMSFILISTLFLNGLQSILGGAFKDILTSEGFSQPLKKHCNQLFFLMALSVVSRDILVSPGIMETYMFR